MKIKEESIDEEYQEIIENEIKEIIENNNINR